MTEGRVQSPCLYGRDPKDCSACQEAEAICTGRVSSDPCRWAVAPMHPNGQRVIWPCIKPAGHKGNHVAAEDYQWNTASEYEEVPDDV